MPLESYVSTHETFIGKNIADVFSIIPTTAAIENTLLALATYFSNLSIEPWLELLALVNTPWSLTAALVNDNNKQVEAAGWRQIVIHQRYRHLLSLTSNLKYTKVHSHLWLCPFHIR